MIDLTQYEDAATLNRWFINNYPLGRIDLAIAEINLDKGIVIFKTIKITHKKYIKHIIF